MLEMLQSVIHKISRTRFTGSYGASHPLVSRTRSGGDDAKE